MRRLALLVIVAVPVALCGQRPPIQQSPRQALVEMFFSDSPLNILKHLPDATKTALQNGGPGFAFGPASLGSDLKRQGKNFQVFEAGSMLVSSEDQRTGGKFEVVIDRDDLMGDQDEMDLSFHTFKNGQEESLTAFYPRVNLKLGLDGGIWKLREIAFNLRLPLDDPEFLKALKEAFPQHGGMADQPAISSLTLLNFAESRYKVIHPDRGFTCSMTELATARFGTGPDPTIIDAALVSGTKDNYKFAITGCGSQPVSTYQITASPLEPGKRAYCSDQSGAIKSSADGQGATCLTSGRPFAAGSQSATGVRTVFVAPPAHEH